MNRQPAPGPAATLPDPNAGHPVQMFEPVQHLKPRPGMEMPLGDITAIRAVAAWINERSGQGWSVPFLTPDGLLLRYPDEGRPAGEPRFHVWLEAGTPVLWDGNEFTRYAADYQPVTTEETSR